MSQRWGSLALLLILAGLLAYVIQDFVDQAIITPFLYLYWLARLLLAAVPQKIIWGVFLGVALISTGRTLWRWRGRSRQIRLGVKPQSGRIEAWLKLIRQADQEIYYKWQLAQQLRRLTLGAMAREQRLSGREIRQQLHAKALDLPPAIQAYFEASTKSLGHLPPSGPVWRRSRPPATPLDIDPEQITQFLEEKFKL